MLNIAVRAARRAGDLILRSMNRVHQLEVRSKDTNDFVTEVDLRFAPRFRITAFSPKKAAAPTASTATKMPMVTTNSSGSSIHWMAPPTSFTASRNSRYPSA
jgi:3'-phosphoadenosine 5'-phosphosulfate (PAPS) 3'-phosphatase